MRLERPCGVGKAGRPQSYGKLASGSRHPRTPPLQGVSRTCDWRADAEISPLPRRSAVRCVHGSGARARITPLALSLRPPVSHTSPSFHAQNVMLGWRQGQRVRDNRHLQAFLHQTTRDARPYSRPSIVNPLLPFSPSKHPIGKAWWLPGLTDGAGCARAMQGERETVRTHRGGRCSTSAASRESVNNDDESTMRAAHRPTRYTANTARPEEKNDAVRHRSK